MFILINRQDMSVVAKVDDKGALLPKHFKPPFILVNYIEEPKLQQFTDLELQIMYRGLGSISGTILNQRSNILLSIHRLLSYKTIANPAQESLFVPEAPIVGADTGSDHPTTATSTTTKLTGNKAAIWEVADAMWLAAGKPQDKQVVLALRKQMMTELEHVHGIKKTTSSNELGSWMKVRVP